MAILWTTKMNHTLLMPRDSKTFESGPSSSFEAPRPGAGASGNVTSFYIVPLGLAYKAGLAGHFPVTDLGMLPLHECDRYNLGPCIDAHRRPPRAGAAGGVDQKVAKPFQPIIITPVDFCGDQSEKKDLAVVSMA